MKLEVNAKTGRATGKASGNLDLEALKGTARALWALSDFSGSAVLFDLRDASVSLTATEVSELAEYTKANSKLRPDAKVAFVVSRDHDFGLARMYETLREQPGLETRVFRDIGAAEEWLEE